MGTVSVWQQDQQISTKRERERVRWPVARGIDCALSDRLRYQEEVVSLWQGYHVIHDCPTGRVGRLPGHLEEPRVDPLADNDVGEQQLVVSEASSSEAVLDGGDLVLHHIRDLTITHTVPVHDDSGWEITVDLGILP